MKIQSLMKAQEMKPLFSAEVIDASGSASRIDIKPLRTLGKGRGAVAELVEITDDSGATGRCVEKIFKPGWLTRFIYWFFFQSPFPYRFSRDAILACLYRRKVAARLLEFAGVDAGSARPYYVRWDDATGAYVLGSEYIQGTSLLVDPLDERFFRRFFRNFLINPVLMLLGRSFRKEQGPGSELDELLPRMKKAEKVFRAGGLVGSGWQVSTAALVSTANFIKRDSQHVLVDIESGVPSLLVPYYLFLSIIRCRFPFFDDVDAKRLKAFSSTHAEELKSKFGQDGAKEYLSDVDLLIEHTQRWKRGEIALFRHNLRLLFPGFSAPIKEARTDVWLKEGILDEGGRERFASSRRFFASGIFLAGVFPGRLGKTFRKLIGNDRYRTDFKRFFQDRHFRREALREYITAHVDKWKNEGRIPEGRSFGSFWGRFFVYLLISRLTPRALHRFLVDGDRRRRVAATIGLFLISEKFQTEYAKYVIFRRLRVWVDDGRMPASEAKLIRTRVEDGSMQEYVRVFGLQVALKFLEAVTTSIKVVGVAWFLKIFVANYPELNPHGQLTLGLLKAFVVTFLHNPIPVIMMINTSVWRTLITLSRMLNIKRKHISYKVALIVGIIPAFGTLAYPLQMYWRCKELSIFLIRDSLVVFSHKIPIYGGKHTRVEIWLVRSANVLAEIMDVLKRAFVGTKLVLRKKPAGEASPAAVSFQEPDRTSRARGDAVGMKRPAEIPPEAGARSAASAQLSLEIPERSASDSTAARKSSSRFAKLVDESVNRIWEKYREECPGEDS